jgi:NAD(P)-dependent dehydrogenase (short-subunit alcohol dehydrogenase family)
MPTLHPAALLTQTVRHDVYDAISPTGVFAGSAEGLVVIITGAGRGIGRAHALAFAHAGARSAHELDEVTAAISALGGRSEVLKVTLDVTDEASVDALFAQVPDVNGMSPSCLSLRALNSDARCS